jgi:cytochrome c
MNKASLKMSKFLKAFLAALLLGAPVAAQELGLGRAALPEEVAAWDIDVRPDGLGLPPGRGDVLTGEEIFSERCAVCHGDFGEAVGRWPVLAGGHQTLIDEYPVKTIGSYWPYLSTVWDYVNRAMPFGAAQTLTDDEIYAVVAYLLFVNDIIEDEEFELNQQNFTSIKLPNEGNFYFDDRDTREIPQFSGQACMENCKESVEITRHAAVLDVTPDETRARQLRAMVEAAKASTQAAKYAAAASASATATSEPAVEAAVEIDPALVSAGAQVFKKCKACHQVGEGAKKRIGPVLNNIIGNPAGASAGFKYSKAMTSAADAGLIWDAANIGQFLAKPKAFLKGTKMSFSGLKKQSDIDAIIAYLRTFDQ